MLNIAKTYGFIGTLALLRVYPCQTTSIIPCQRLARGVNWRSPAALLERKNNVPTMPYFAQGALLTSHSKIEMAVRQRKAAHASNRVTKHRKPLNRADVQDMSRLRDIFRRQPVWIVLAVSSGACAAFNGVFAKLTTTALTSTLASHIATAFSLSPDNKIVEIAVRGFFFGMNLLFNAAMWALFTAALTRGDSTTRVSIVNVSANFMITAILGWMIFGEKLPAMWWLGASFLAVGNVVIGRREEGEKPGGTVGLDETREEAENLLGETSGQDRDQCEEDLMELDEALHNTSPSEEQVRIRKAEDVDAPL